MHNANEVFLAETCVQEGTIGPSHAHLHPRSLWAAGPNPVIVSNKTSFHCTGIIVFPDMFCLLKTGEAQLNPKCVKCCHSEAPGSLPDIAEELHQALCPENASSIRLSTSCSAVAALCALKSNHIYQLTVDEIEDDRAFSIDRNTAKNVYPTS